MIFGSVCSGIEAASVAWAPLGWRAAFFSEIEAFPCSVLKERHAGVPNHGDMTKFQEWPDHAIDLLVGGTPCQSFSVAGLRAGLADPRGSLMLTYLAIAAKYRPRWLVWENVPGVLSSNDGRDFGSLLGGLGELGYGFAYRVLDAQFCRASGLPFAVPQRRRRVFVVGYIGDWRRAAAVLFDGASLRGDPAPRRQAGQRIAPTISARTKGGGGLGTDFDLDGGLIQTASTGDVSHCLNAGGMGRIDYETETMIATHAIQAGALRENPNSGPDGVGVQADIAYTLEARAEVQAVSVTGEITHTLKAEGFDASEDGTGRGNPIIAQTVALRGREGGATAELGGEVATALRASQGGGDKPHVLTSAVRRLIPTECERLQGFPDNYTKISDKTADGPRYKALGNSMAVNVMRVLGERIALVDAISAQRAAA